MVIPLLANQDLTLVLPPLRFGPLVKFPYKISCPHFTWLIVLCSYLDLFTSVSLCAKKEELTTESTLYIDKFHEHVFNHMITFEPFMNQDKVTKDNVSIKITLHSRTLVDEDLVIGEAHIGPDTTEEGILHWNEMVSHTRTAVAQWHRLIF